MNHVVHDRQLAAQFNVTVKLMGTELLKGWSDYPHLQAICIVWGLLDEASKDCYLNFGINLLHNRYPLYAAAPIRSFVNPRHQQSTEDVEKMLYKDGFASTKEATLAKILF